MPLNHVSLAWSHRTFFSNLEVYFFLKSLTASYACRDWLTYLNSYENFQCVVVGTEQWTSKYPSSQRTAQLPVYFRWEYFPWNRLIVYKYL